MGEKIQEIAVGHLVTILLPPGTGKSDRIIGPDSVKSNHRNQQRYKRKKTEQLKCLKPHTTEVSQLVA